MIDTPFLWPMSPKSFSDTMSLYMDFNRSYLFRVMFFDSGIVNLAASILTTNLISTTATPVSTTNPIALGWQGTKTKIAGKTDFSDWKVTIRDDRMNTAYTYLQEWRDAVYNVKEGTSAPIDTNSNLFQNLLTSGGYKKQAIVILLGNHTDSLQQILTPDMMVRAYLLKGIWPKDVGEISLDYSSENIITFPITFSLDYFEPYSVTSLITSTLNV